MDGKGRIQRRKETGQGPPIGHKTKRDDMDKKIGFIGLGNQGKGAMIKVFERILGVEFRKLKEDV